MEKPIRNKLTKIIKDIIKSPKNTDANKSPKIIAHKEIGEETNLSRVFILVSQGVITGVIAETEKNKAIPNKPGIRKSTDISRLKEKEINKKAGIKSV